MTAGLRDELPDIPGLRERWARDVLHCPYCHGHEVRDRTPPDTLTTTERSQLVARAIGVVEEKSSSWSSTTTGSAACG